MPHAYTDNQPVGQPAIGLFAELFSAVGSALLAADCEWREMAVKQSPSFCPLSLLGPDENALSKIISDLLDPHGSHGQGEAFLMDFLSRCGSVGRNPKGGVSIEREACTVFGAKRRRRMDILVDGKGWGIAIENKPWADEQEDQLQDYSVDLEQRYGQNFLLIRLTGKDGSPRSMSLARQDQLSKQGRFVSWHYTGEFLSWVKDCQLRSEAQRVRSFLEEFSRYITTEFGPATNHRAAMERKHVLPAMESALEKDPGQLQYAAAIADAFPELRQRFIGRLFDEIQTDVLAHLGPGWAALPLNGNFVESDWAKFAFTHPEWADRYWVTLESQPKYGQVVLGIWHDKTVPRREAVQQDLKRLGWGRTRATDFWEGYSPLPEPFTDWSTVAGIAAVVEQRAELKYLLTEAFVMLCRHFKEPLAELAREPKP